MRKFIVSDLHGNGGVYDSIMGFLENVSLKEDVELYINGDLIDRGLDSLRMLLDVMERVKNPSKIKIHYLGGNHELMMYQALRKRKPGKTVNTWSNWLLNGGHVIEGTVDEMPNGDQLFDQIRDFTGELGIYHIFNERILENPIVVVHAQIPREFKMMKISDNDRAVSKAVWRREKDEFGIPHSIGKKGYFGIVGHTPVSKGFLYNGIENYINIDGGCAGYAIGQFQYNKVPLVEIKEDSLDILLFNHNNQIVNGYHFNGSFTKMGDEELNKNRILLDPQFDGQEEKYQREILEEHKRLKLF